MKLNREIVRVGRLTAWSEAQASQVVTAWRGSGVSRAEFGRSYGIPVHRLYYWIAKLDSDTRQESRIRFHPVEVVAAADETAPKALEIRVLRIPAGFPADEVRAVLGALEVSSG
jgi:hypothetical protein